MYTIWCFFFSLSTGDVFHGVNAGPANARFDGVLLSYITCTPRSVFQLDFVSASMFCVISTLEIERLVLCCGSAICERILRLVRRCRSWVSKWLDLESGKNIVGTIYSH